MIFHVYFLDPSNNGDGVLLQLENDIDILHMCCIGMAHLDKYVHVYYEHIVDDFFNIVGGVLNKVVVNQTKDEVEGIDTNLNKEIEMSDDLNNVTNV